MIATSVARAAVRLPATDAEAQALIDGHLESVPFTGRCTTCSEPAPCPSREPGHAVFQRLGTLPQRTARRYRAVGFPGLAVAG